MNKILGLDDEFTLMGPQPEVTGNEDLAILVTKRDDPDGGYCWHMQIKRDGHVADSFVSRSEDIGMMADMVWRRLSLYLEKHP